MFTRIRLFASLLFTAALDRVLDALGHTVEGAIADLAKLDDRLIQAEKRSSAKVARLNGQITASFAREAAVRDAEGNRRVALYDTVMATEIDAGRAARIRDRIAKLID